jgi:hypothetical protein
MMPNGITGLERVKMEAAASPHAALVIPYMPIDTSHIQQPFTLRRQICENDNCCKNFISSTKLFKKHKPFFILNFILRVFSYIFAISQQMHCSDSLLVSYSSYMFRRMHVIIRESYVMYPAELHLMCICLCMIYVKQSVHSVVVVNKTFKIWIVKSLDTDYIVVLKSVLCPDCKRVYTLGDVTKQIDTQSPFGSHNSSTTTSMYIPPYGQSTDINTTM